jgi:hypothetical protein
MNANAEPCWNGMPEKKKMEKENNFKFSLKIKLSLIVIYQEVAAFNILFHLL